MHNVADIEPKGSISTCPSCGYKDGFHVSFDIQNTTKKAKIILICPNCHKHFQMGWNIEFTENTD